jgi:hypothetical protein
MNAVPEEQRRWPESCRARGDGRLDVSFHRRSGRTKFQFWLHFRRREVMEPMEEMFHWNARDRHYITNYMTCCSRGWDNPLHDLHRLRFDKRQPERFRLGRPSTE